MFSRSPLGCVNTFSFLSLLLTPRISLSVSPISPYLLTPAFPLFLPLYLHVSCIPHTYLMTAPLLGFLLYPSILPRLRYPILFQLALLIFSPIQLYRLWLAHICFGMLRRSTGPRSAIHLLPTSIWKLPGLSYLRYLQLLCIFLRSYTLSIFPSTLLVSYSIRFCNPLGAFNIPAKSSANINPDNASYFLPSFTLPKTATIGIPWYQRTCVKQRRTHPTHRIKYSIARAHILVFTLGYECMKQR